MNGRVLFLNLLDVSRFLNIIKTDIINIKNKEDAIISNASCVLKYKNRIKINNISPSPIGIYFFIHPIKHIKHIKKGIIKFFILSIIMKYWLSIADK